MTKLEWDRSRYEPDPARVTDVGSYGMLRDGERIGKSKKARAKKRAKKNKELLARSEHIRLEQVAAKRARAERRQTDVQSSSPLPDRGGG